MQLKRWLSKLYLVSACLLGVNCRYDGDNNYNQRLFEYFEESLLYPVCPEVMGGLSIPRKPCEIVQAEDDLKVKDIDGNDKTKQFVQGAQKTLKIAELLNIKKAIFMERSPSCGVHKIYDGKFNNNLISGQGITTKLLEKNDIKVYSNNKLNKIKFN